MEQKKSTLKEIKATVMPQTAEGLQMLMEETGLTIGEVIDRLTLQMCPDDLGFAVCFAQDQVFFSISSLPEEEQEEALTKIIIFLAGLVPVDHLKGLEQAAISKRAERLKEYKEYIEDLPEKDTNEDITFITEKINEMNLRVKIVFQPVKKAVNLLPPKWNQVTMCLETEHDYIFYSWVTTV